MRTAVTYRVAFGPLVGHKVFTLRGAQPREAAPRQLLCADIDSFSLHVAVHCEANDPKRLEQLCRHITRPALSDGRVQCKAAGHAELKLKAPWRDGTTHLVMSPLEFMHRLAALIPRPRLHLIRFLGVPAPNAKLRRWWYRKGENNREGRAKSQQTPRPRPRPSWLGRTSRINWARLLKRAFDIDVHRCSNCGAGELKIIAAILERPVIEKLLAHLGWNRSRRPRRRREMRCRISRVEQHLTALVQPPQLQPPMPALRLSISAVGCPLWVEQVPTPYPLRRAVRGALGDCADDRTHQRSFVLAGTR